jgi:hypothetical protein
MAVWVLGLVVGKVSEVAMSASLGRLAGESKDQIKAKLENRCFAFCSTMGPCILRAGG